jgi:hypothetical protein
MRVLVQVQLMIVLGIPPLLRRQNLGDNLPVVPLLICLGRHLASDLLLLGRVEEDTAAVLSAAVWALRVEGCGVVHAVEKLEELSVRDLGGVVDELGSFRVYWAVVLARCSSRVR